MATYGEIIKNLREGVGLTQMKLAVNADVSTASISKLENNIEVSNLVLGKICSALGITIEQLQQEAMKNGFEQQAQQQTLTLKTEGWDKVWIQKKETGS